jgi:protein-L-isoaspartate(D-aspartate) O-methyltransferase
MNDDIVAAMQQQMVEIIAAHTFYVREQLGKSQIDAGVLATMARIPRHAFVPLELAPYAYADQPLPIGYEKTISQPFIVALMTDLLAVAPTDSVLEIGTGLGYHTAILASLARQVYTIEIVEELGEQAATRLKRLGIANIVCRIGNGQGGWPEYAPFDCILVCAGVEMILPALLMQLKPGGRMVVPTGMAEEQALTLVERGADGRYSTREILPVRFAMLETMR